MLENNEWDIAVLKIQIRSSRIRPLVSHLKGLKLHYSKTGVQHSDNLPK
jgi:hypothetical protein